MDWTCPQQVREQKQVPVPTMGQLFGLEEKHTRLIVRPLICDSLNRMQITQTILAAAVCALDEDTGP